MMKMTAYHYLLIHFFAGLFGAVVCASERNNAEPRIENEIKVDARIHHHHKADNESHKKRANKKHYFHKVAVIEPEMVRIQGGCFQMGSPKSEPERDDNEKQHQVCVENFEIGKYEVTQAQWQSVMGKNPSRFSKCGGNCPVENVSWNDVQDFIAKLNQETGRVYRLPTAAEWEYAARAGTTSAFYTGNCITTERANYDGTVNDYNHCGAKTDVAKNRPVAVGSYPANGYGLYDMAGNVGEWTSDCYGGDCSLRVLGGGSWIDTPRSLRSAARFAASLNDHDEFKGVRLSRR